MYQGLLLFIALFQDDATTAMRSAAVRLPCDVGVAPANALKLPTEKLYSHLLFFFYILYVEA